MLDVENDIETDVRQMIDELTGDDLISGSSN